jgi:oligoendopeptidase F
MRYPLLAIVVLAIPAWGHAQQPRPQDQSFDPFDGENREAYRFDLDRNFYTPSDADVEHERLMAEFARLSTSARSAKTATELTRLLRQQDTVMKRVSKYTAYRSLRTLINTSDADSQRRLNNIRAGAGAAYNDVNNAILAAPENLLADAQRAGYGPAISQIRAPGLPNVTNDAANNSAALMADATSWGPALFQSTLASLKYDPIQTPEGPLNFRTQANEIFSHTDRSVRERGFTMNQAALYQNRETFANILTRTATKMNEAARLLGFADYLEQSYRERSLTKRDVTSVLEEIADSSGAAKEYEQLRIARIRQQLGYDTVHVWDLTAPGRNAKAPRLTVADAKRVILAATAPLGPDYTREMSRLLDPANGRLDMLPREGRVDRPGFSTGLVGYPSTFYQGRYEGFSRDVVIFGHEAGHAVQNMLMDKAGVLPRYAWGASYFTESFALFNEMLILDYLARTSKSEADRIYFRQALLDQVSDLYTNAWYALVEQQVFENAAAGRTLDAAGMEALTQQTASGFSSWFGPNSEMQLQWVQPWPLYTRPLYEVNYVYAKLLALTYFDLMQKNPQDFVQRYNVLLSRGYDAPPEQLLQRSLGISLDADAMVARASAMMRKWTAELRSEYDRDRG